MHMFRPRNEFYEQFYNNQSSIKPAIEYRGGNRTQTQCFDAQLPGAGCGYGKQQHAAGAHGYGLQKPYGQYDQQGSYGSVQHGGHGGATHHQRSCGSMMQGGGRYGGATQHHESHATRYQQGGYGLSHGSAQHGSSFGSGCEGQSGGYRHSMKKRERRCGRTRSGNDSDSSCSDDSDHFN